MLKEIIKENLLRNVFQKNNTMEQLLLLLIIFDLEVTINIRILIVMELIIENQIKEVDELYEGSIIAIKKRNFNNLILLEDEFQYHEINLDIDGDEQTKQEKIIEEFVEKVE